MGMLFAILFGVSFIAIVMFFSFVTHGECKIVPTKRNGVVKFVIKRRNYLNIWVVEVVDPEYFMPYYFSTSEEAERFKLENESQLTVSN